MSSLLALYDPLYTLTGFVVGLIVGMTGVGGGALMTPALVLLFGVHPATAVGTDLLYAGLTKGRRHGRAWPQPDRRLARHPPLAAGSLPTSLATLGALHALGISGDFAASIISKALAVALLFTAAAIVVGLRAGRRPEERPEPPHRGATSTILLGVALGFLVTISSVGAGAVGVTALMILYPRMSIVRIVGSDIAHAVPLTLVAGPRARFPRLRRLDDARPRCCSAPFPASCWPAITRRACRTAGCGRRWR
jgi:uncharacterized membrane protein YfcA